jgi:hypothetical protein
MSLRPPDEVWVKLSIGFDQAEAMQSAIADVLCWIRDWRAGASEQALDNDPIGTDMLRDLNIMLKRGIESAYAEKRDQST